MFHQTNTLTTDQDVSGVIVGSAGTTNTDGDDTFSAVYDTTTAANSTLTAFDDLDGGDGADTLTILTADTIAAGDFSALGLTFANIETLVVRSTAAVDLDETDISGFTTVSIVATTGTVGVDSDTATSVSVTNGAAVTIDDVSDDTDVLTSVVVDGASGTVSVTGDSVTSVTLTDLTAAGGYDNSAAAGTRAITLNADGVVTAAGGAVDFDDTTATSVVINTSGTASEIDAEIDAATTLTVNAAADLELTAGDITALETLTVTGAGDFTSDVSGGAALESVIGSASTGAIDVTVANTVTAVSTGSGDDTVTYTGAIAANTTVSLGAGDDTIAIVAANASTASVAGGAGTDTISITGTAATLLSTVSAGTFSSFEVLQLEATAGGTITMSRLADVRQVVVNGDLASTTAVSAAAAGTSLLYQADTGTTDAITYTLADATGTDDSLAITMGVAGTTGTDGIEGGDLSADDIESISIASLGDGVPATANTLDLIATDALETLTITGDHDLTLDVTDATIEVISAGSATGDLNLSGVAVLAAGASITTGSGDDTIVGSAGDDTIISGAGADDITLAGGNDTVTTGAGADTIDTTGVAIDGTEQFSITDFTFGASGDTLEFAIADFDNYAAGTSVIINAAAAVSIGDITEATNAGVNYLVVDTAANLLALDLSGSLGGEVVLGFASDSGEFYAAADGDFTAADLVGIMDAGTLVAANVDFI